MATSIDLFGGDWIVKEIPPPGPAPDYYAAVGVQFKITVVPEAQRAMVGYDAELSEISGIFPGADGDSIKLRQLNISGSLFGSIGVNDSSYLLLVSFYADDAEHPLWTDVFSADLQIRGGHKSGGN